MNGFNEMQQGVTWAMERRFLSRLAWILPLLLGLALPYLRSHAWALMALDPGAVIALSLRAWIGWMLAGALSGLVVVGIWRLGWRMAPGPAVGPVSIVLALLLCLGVETVTRQRPVSELLWSGVRVRATGDDDFFIGEAALFRRLGLATASAERPRLLVFGTSQLISAVDFDLLQERLPDVVVERRCLPAMITSRMLMTEPFLGVRSNDLVLVYWSEFDMAGEAALDATWFRPFANARGLRALGEAYREAGGQPDWRDALDVRWAAWCELWRSRDAWRMLLFSSMGGRLKAAGAAPADRLPATETFPATGANDEKTNYEQRLVSDAGFAMNLRAAVQLLRAWHEVGARVVVLEGSVHPDMDRPISARRREQARAALAAAARETGAYYVPASGQTFVPERHHWVDLTHLNLEGRALFTRSAGDLLAVGPATERGVGGSVE